MMNRKIYHYLEHWRLDNRKQGLNGTAASPKSKQRAVKSRPKAGGRASPGPRPATAGSGYYRPGGMPAFPVVWLQMDATRRELGFLVAF